MRQFLLPADWEGGESCRLSGGQAHYLYRVLRLRAGDQFAALDRAGARRDCEIVEAEPGMVLLRVGPARAAPPPGTEQLADAHSGARAPRGTAAVPAELPAWPRITLIQSTAKGPAMDLVIRQAAEAGVSRIIPYLADRSVARPPLEMGGSGVPAGGGAADRGTVPRGEAQNAGAVRRERIVREALQQSGSPIATRIEPVCDFDGLSRLLGPGHEGSIRLLLHESPLAEISLHEYLCVTPEEIAVCIGPEGGFSDAEVSAFERIGFLPLHLPGAILRTETAALFAVAAVETVLLEHSSWIPR